MKSIMLSIQPKYCEMIAGGRKTIEVRKTAPKLGNPFKCYIYCTKGKVDKRGRHLFVIEPRKRKDFGNVECWCSEREQLIVNGGYLAYTDYLADGKVIGEFVCDYIDEFESEFSKRQDVEQAIYSVDYDEDDGERNVCFMVGEPDDNRLLRNACLTWQEIKNYIGYSPFQRFYGWHISALKIYDKPKELCEFFTTCHKLDCDQCGDCPHLRVARCSYPCDDDIDTWCGVDNCKPLTRPPQSWGYVEIL